MKNLLKSYYILYLVKHLVKRFIYLFDLKYPFQHEAGIFDGQKMSLIIKSLVREGTLITRVS